MKYDGIEVDLHAYLISALMEVNGQLHSSAALSPVKDLSMLIDKKQGGFQRRITRCREKKITRRCWK
jgi:hypothetical protein